MNKDIPRKRNSYKASEDTLKMPIPQASRNAPQTPILPQLQDGAGDAPGDSPPGMDKTPHKRPSQAGGREQSSPANESHCAAFESSLRIVILSRGRSDSIQTHRILPMATLVCPESEAQAYGKHGLEIVATPDHVIGLGRLRNWILDHFPEEIIVMADDDVIGVRHVGDLVHKDMRDGEIAYQLIVNAALCAKDLGVGAFGFNQHWDVRKYKPDRPFRLNTWAGGMIGIIGRDIRFLDRHLFKVDVDFFLENLLHKRIVWIENRFSFVQVRDRNKGGNSLFRTQEKVQEEIDFLKRKWQGHFDVRQAKTTIVTAIHVPR